MSIRTETIQHFTCDNCGYSMPAPGNSQINLNTSKGELFLAYRFDYPNPNYDAKAAADDCGGVGRSSNVYPKLGGHICMQCLKDALRKWLDA
jgi:hypothetical protein